MGLFAAGPGIAALSIVMKGREIHGGHAHRLYTGMPNKLDLSQEMIQALVTNKNVTMRIGLVCYPSERAFSRRSCANMYPPCGFGPSMPFRSGISKEAYVSDGGRRLFRSEDRQRSYVFEEVAMQIGNIAARMGCDPKRAVEAFSSNLYDPKKDTHIVLRYPEWQWDANRKKLLDGYLNWHIVVSRLFLFNIDIEKDLHVNSQTLDSHTFSADKLAQLYNEVLKGRKPKSTADLPKIKSIVGASIRNKDNVGTIIANNCLSHQLTQACCMISEN